MKNESPNTGLNPKTKAFIENHGIVLYIWILLISVRLFLDRASLFRGELKGNDDHMRMVQIRDWLGGQNWFDLYQYRLNPSDPLLSHWSRLTDILVGVPIWILSPILGQKNAELITVIAFPSILLLVFLYLIIALTRELKRGTSVPLAAAFMTALSFATIAQFDLGRIDHHGLQIAMAVVCCWFIIKSRTQNKYAAFAGILAGLGLYVGIESAPYIAAACASIVFVWVLDEERAEVRLRFFGLAMAASTMGCLALSAPPARWLTPSCDAISVVYTNLTLSVAVVMWLLSMTSNKVKSGWSRFIAASILGGACLAVTVLLYPHCFAGPYAEVDPRLVEFWLSNVSEAKPFHTFFLRKPVGGMAMMILPVFAFIGYGIYHRQTGEGFSIAPRSVMIFMITALIAGMVQIRLMGYASSFAIPFAAFLLVASFTWAEKFESPLKRAALRLGFVVLLAPITIPLLLGFLVPQIPTPSTDDTDKATCIEQPVLSRLKSLTPGLALTQIDLGAPLLYHAENLKVTSAPYHRNTDGNLASIDMFFGDEQTAKSAVSKVNADYVIACRDSNETEMIVHTQSKGMLARLSMGYVPSWLEVIELEGAESLLIYRVVDAQEN